jgi:hypothetical protein
MTYRSTSERTAEAAVNVALIVFWLAAVFGWVMNVVKFAQALSAPLTGMELFRGLGIIVAPIGCILGFL